MDSMFDESTGVMSMSASRVQRFITVAVRNRGDACGMVRHLAQEVDAQLARALEDVALGPLEPAGALLLRAAPLETSANRATTGARSLDLSAQPQFLVDVFDQALPLLRDQLLVTHLCAQLLLQLRHLTVGLVPLTLGARRSLTRCLQFEVQYVAVLVKAQLRDRRRAPEGLLGQLPVLVDRWPRLTVLGAAHHEHVHLLGFHRASTRSRSGPRGSATGPSIRAGGLASTLARPYACARWSWRSRFWRRPRGSCGARRVEPHDLGARDRAAVAPAHGVMRAGMPALELVVVQSGVVAAQYDLALEVAQARAQLLVLPIAHFVAVVAVDVLGSAIARRKQVRRGDVRQRR